MLQRPTGLVSFTLVILPFGTALGAALGAGAGLATGVLFAAPAAAHAELLSSDPRDGARLDTSPDVVTLTFAEEIDSANARSRVSLTGLDGETRTLDPKPSVDGERVTVPLGELTGAGAYTVTFRVVSEDAHPVEGAVHFLVEAAAAGSTTAATTTGATTTAAAPAAAPPASTAAATTTTTTAAAIPGVTGSLDDVDPVWIYLGAGLAVLGAGGTAVALASRRRTP